MDQGWAAVIAAIAAGVFGIAGALCGIVVGRRQAADQATVEHGHWLREQRLKAHTDLLTHWDEAIQEMGRFQDGWNEQVESLQEGGFVVHPSDVAARKWDEVWPELRPRLEQAELLGPSAVTEAVHDLRAVWREVSDMLHKQGSQDPFERPRIEWLLVMARASEERSNFHVAVSNVMRTPPNPRGEPLP
ncbi:hypothetical protein QF035_008892 [Streptomyces umbrinus]|uniref:Secreted protein n=1 Tax=Streptomyces umbrinus TaxID=67370 RepID=A0ABU0T674_9ACTN|nr:hypothetical protein [Streptomyces umbrinus]MDQ1031310.1 hypothetical protein [Streptomyces umbrinus]